MQVDLWKKIEEVFQAALAQPANERAAYVRRACPDDPELREEVESLLAQQADSFLESSPLSALQTLRPGMKLGSFEIVELLGRGGMGEVWRARDPRLKREVAIKLLPPAFAHDPERVARFETEARAASALNHPNVVSVFDIGSENGVYWIVTELVDGESLAAVMRRSPLAPRKAVEIATQIAAGLAAAHAAGIVHRDLKPGNIMLRRDGRVRIVDFGLAKRTVEDIDSATLTDSGVVLGTAAYMAPEQVRGRRPDHRVDLFSLGVVLYEMLSGKPPFAADSSVEVMHAILNDEPAALPPVVPPALDRIVRRCLEKEPSRRFQSAADLEFALESAGTAQSPAPATKRPWRWWAIAVVGCLTAVAAAYWWGARLRPAGIAGGNRLQRLTADSGLTTDAAVSADGKFVAYASDRADGSNLDIWIQRIGSIDAVQLTHHPADDYDPSISPDGSQVAFRSDRDGGGIYLMPVEGGEARQLIPGGWRPRFSPDGQMLMYSIGPMADSPSDPKRVYVQRLSGETPTRIASNCLVHPFSAVWSPDSRRILFHGSCQGRVGLWLSTLDGIPSYITDPQSAALFIDQWLTNPPRLLMPLVAGDTHEEASISVLPISEDGTRITGAAERLTFGTGPERHASAGGARVALSALTYEQHVWGVPIDHRGHSTGPSRQLTSGDAHQVMPSLSRDGRKLLFTSTDPGHPGRPYLVDLRTGKKERIPWDGQAWNGALNADATRVAFQRPGLGIFEGPLSGGFPRKIIDFLADHCIGTWDWSPDGATLLWFKNHPAIQQLDMKSLSRTMYLEDPEFQLWEAHFSPDGRWVVFGAQKAGRNSVYVAPFRKAPVPRSEWILIADTGWEDKPRFSADGKLVFFSSERDGFRCIWAQPVGPDLHPAGGAFAVYHEHERRRSLRNLGFEGWELAVGPDMVVFNQEERTGNIWLLEPDTKAR